MDPGGVEGGQMNITKNFCMESSKINFKNVLGLDSLGDYPFFYVRVLGEQLET